MQAITRVLVVDDSAVMRGIMSRIIDSQPDMKVAGIASDPVIAIERLRNCNPDVITLDVEMPRMDGLAFLAKLMQWRPLPVVMVSSLTERGAETTLRALELGAVDFMAKPQFAEGEGLDGYAEQVVEKIRAAAGARVGRRAATPASAPRRLARPATPLALDRVIAIGASTGGVEALRAVLAPLPSTMPPMLIAQHMPAGFTRSFAQRLDAACEVGVKEAEDGEPLHTGHAYIAPGGRHLTLARKGGALLARLSSEAPVNRHRPSVDVLFRSVALAAGERSIGLMLSGMGADGAEAMLELRLRGARNIAQDEASCVVFGMPKQAIARGGVHEVLPLDAIARRLVELSLAIG
jgi:two-component system chemotaxis response regulator CheB